MSDSEEERSCVLLYPNFPAVRCLRAALLAHSGLNLPTLRSFVDLPDVFVVMDVNLVKLLRQEIVIDRHHVPNHVQDQKTWQNGQH